MNLWVRSQDKEKLLKCNDIAISNNMINDGASIKFKGYKIVGYFDKNTEYEILGTYKTKERAIEVLDEIEEKIILINTINIAKDTVSLIAYKNALPEEKIKGLGYPYQMPKD
jgi:hypothetical protein|nr:MAG TPA: hypothetical protein [Caudoviricetes sp.]